MEAFRILDLPIELQSAILELVVVREPLHRRRRYENDDEPASLYDLQTILGLSLTHRQFRQAVLPFQYTALNVPLSFADSSSYRRLKSLARSIQGNPPLGLYCQRLRVSVRGSNPEYRHDEAAYENMNRIMGLVPRVRVLKFDWNCDPEERRQFSKLLRTCVASMSGLETIHLNTADVDLADAVISLQTSSLKKVKISRLYVVEAGQLGEVESKDPAESNISELVIAGCRMSAAVFGHLVNRPKRLERLTVSGLSDDVGRLDPALIVTMLKKHEHSLKSICIRNFSFSESATQDVSMDFSGFTALEDLQLYRWSTNDSMEPKLTSQDAGRLLAPRLRKFTWDFVVHDLRNEYVDDIKAPEVQWLRDLAAAAVRRQSTLGHIHANFQPSRADLRLYPESSPASWVSMDKLNAEFAPQGIKFTYPTLQS